MGDQEVPQVCADRNPPRLSVHGQDLALEVVPPVRNGDHGAAVSEVDVGDAQRANLAPAQGGVEPGCP